MNTTNNLTALKNKCAKVDLYAFNDIPKEYLSDRFTEKNKDGSIKLPSELLLKYTHDMFFKCTKQFKHNAPTEVDYYHIEDYNYVIFLSPKGNLIRLSNHKGKFSFCLDWSHYKEVQNIAHHKKEAAIKESGIKEPNSIGVFTDKKINDWFEYLDKLVDVHNAILSQAKDKNAEIEAEIQTFINSVKCTVQKRDTKTWVYTKHFEVIFTHHKGEMWLSTEIEYKGTLNEVTAIENNQ